MDKGLVLDLYRRMVRIREFENAVAQLYARGLMPGLAHAYIGEEAVAVGVCAALKPDDYITSTHRGHGHLIAKGGKTDRMMAEILGKEAGYNRGRGGTMHIADVSLGILGANGIVGGGLAIAAGAGWSCKELRTGRVSVCFFGDGAANEGILMESMNMAAIWKLPVIYVCENNLYGEYTGMSLVTAGDRLGARAEAMGIPVAEVDGQDVLAVYDTLLPIVDRVRGGAGPQFVECKTYRFNGHHGGDPGTSYRTAEEVNYWRTNRDPIRILADRLLADRICTPDEIQSVGEEILREVEDSVEFAKGASFPDVSEVSRYVHPDA